MPRIGPSEDRLNKIMKVLESVGNKGIWIRELARQTGLPVSTVHHYLKHHMVGRVEIKNVEIGRFAAKQMKIVRLK